MEQHPPGLCDLNKERFSANFTGRSTKEPPREESLANVCHGCDMIPGSSKRHRFFTDQKDSVVGIVLQLFTIALLVATAFYSLKQVRLAAIATQYAAESADAATAAVGVATRTLNHDVAREALQDTTDRMSRTQAREDFERNAMLAESSLRATIDASRLDQRAWVATYSFEYQHPAPDQNVFIAYYKNTGRTPATKCRSSLSGTMLFKQIGTKDTDSGEQRGALLPPEVPSHLSTEEFSIPDAILANATEKHPYYLYGGFWYKDVFRRNHWTQFCVETYPPFKVFAMCNTHNDSDDGDETKR